MDAIAYLAGRSALGIGMGPTLAHFVYDHTQTYVTVIWAIIPLSVLTSLAFLTVPAYPTFEEPSDHGENA